VDGALAGLGRPALLSRDHFPTRSPLRTKPANYSFELFETDKRGVDVEKPPGQGRLLLLPGAPKHYARSGSHGNRRWRKVQKLHRTMPSFVSALARMRLERNQQRNHCLSISVPFPLQRLCGDARHRLSRGVSLRTSVRPIMRPCATSPLPRVRMGRSDPRSRNRRVPSLPATLEEAQHSSGAQFGVIRGQGSSDRVPLGPISPPRGTRRYGRSARRPWEPHSSVGQFSQLLAAANRSAKLFLGPSYKYQTGGSQTTTSSQKRVIPMRTAAGTHLLRCNQGRIR